MVKMFVKQRLLVVKPRRMYVADVCLLSALSSIVILLCDVSVGLHCFCTSVVKR